MERVWLAAKKPHRYANVWRQPGEVFSAKRADAKVLKAARFAVDAPPPGKKVGRKREPDPLPPPHETDPEPDAVIDTGSPASSD